MRTKSGPYRDYQQPSLGASHHPVCHSGFLRIVALLGLLYEALVGLLVALLGLFVALLGLGLDALVLPYALVARAVPALDGLLRLPVPPVKRDIYVGVVTE